MKKIITAILVALLLLSTLAGCSKADKKPNIQATDSSEDVTFKGYVDTSNTTDNIDSGTSSTTLKPIEPNDPSEIGFASRPEERYRREIAPVDALDNTISMIIDIRNRETEKQCNAKIVYMEAPQLWGTAADRNIPNFVKKEVNAGANSKVDVIFANAAYTVNNSTRGYVVNFNDSRVLKYMNIDDSYWNQNYISNATVYDQLYWIIGDINLSVYDSSIATFINLNKAVTELDTDINEIYNKIKNGKWTFKQFSDYVTQYTCLEGDSSTDVKLATASPNEAYNGYYAAFNISTVKTRADGSHDIVVENNDRLSKGANMVHELYHGENASDIFMAEGENAESDAFKRFVSGNSLFLVDILYRNLEQNVTLRTAPFDYAILPMPLFDENQFDPSLDCLGYYTTPINTCNTISVLVTHTDKMDIISKVLDDLSFRTLENGVAEIYYTESLLKEPNTSIQEYETMMKMLDMILNGSIYDFGIIYPYQTNHYALNTWRAVCEGTEYSSVNEYWATISTKTAEAIKAFDMFYSYQASA